VDRDPNAIELTYSGGTQPERVARYADLGVARWVVAVWETEPEAYQRAFDQLATTLVGPLG
jgi:hypothetical protein